MVGVEDLGEAPERVSRLRSARGEAGTGERDGQHGGGDGDRNQQLAAVLGGVALPHGRCCDGVHGGVEIDQLGQGLAVDVTAPGHQQCVEDPLALQDPLPDQRDHDG